MRTSTIKLSALLACSALYACTGTSARRDLMAQQFAGGAIPSAPGSRIAVVLTRTSANPVTPGYAGEGAGGQTYPGQGQKSTLSAGNNSPASASFGCRQGLPGSIQIVSVTDNERQVIGGGAQSQYRAGVSAYGNGVRGLPIFNLPLMGGVKRDGITAGHIAISPEGSLALAALTDCDQIMTLPLSSNGAVLGAPIPIHAPGKPTQIATVRTPDGIYAAVATSRGVLIYESRIDGTYGNVRMHFLSGVGSNRGSVSSVAFLPPLRDGSRYLMMGIDPRMGGTGPSPMGGSVWFCNFNELIGAPRSSQEAYYSETFPPGCFPGDPAMANGDFEAYPFARGSGVQQVKGIPTRVFANSHMALYLSEQLGPCRLRTPNSVGLDTLYDDVLPSSCFYDMPQSGGPSFIGRNRGSIQFTDAALLPSNYVVALESDRLVQFRTGNAYELSSRYETPVPGASLTSIAIDPGAVDSDGSSANFALITDSARNRLLVASMSRWILAFDGVSAGYVQLQGQSPIASAIQPIFVNPSAAYSKAQPNAAVK